MCCRDGRTRITAYHATTPDAVLSIWGRQKRDGVEHKRRGSSGGLYHDSWFAGLCARTVLAYEGAGFAGGLSTAVGLGTNPPR